MNEELSVLLDVHSKLDQANVPYMVTGSIANNFYAQPRMTRDIDIVITLGLSDIKQFVAIFKGDYVIDEELIRQAFKGQKLFNMIHNKTLVKVDFIIKKDSPYRRLEFERRQKLAIDANDVWVVSREDLIISKLTWAKDSKSALQFSDIKNLLDTAPLDLDYILKWTETLGLTSVYDEVISK